MLRGNWTQARYLFTFSGNEILDLSMGILLPAMPRIWMVREEDYRIHGRAVHGLHSPRPALVRDTVEEQTLIIDVCSYTG